MIKDFIEEASSNRSDRLLPNDFALISPSSCSPLFERFCSHLLERLSAWIEAEIEGACWVGRRKLARVGDCSEIFYIS